MFEPGPCLEPDSAGAVEIPASLWTSGARYALAIPRLVHESVILSGIVGGGLPNGFRVGDPQAEVKAECQRHAVMRHVVEQLGEAPDDSQAIADSLSVVGPRRKRGVTG